MLAALPTLGRPAALCKQNFPLPPGERTINRAFAVLDHPTVSSCKF